MATIIGTDKDDDSTLLVGLLTGHGHWLLGGDEDDDMFGLGGDDLMIAGDGDDHLNGGTGADIMGGGDGDDTYIVDNVADETREVGTTGFDRVITFVTFTLSEGIERLTLAATAGAIDGTGNELDNLIEGNDFANVLDGRDGEDEIRGEDNADTLFGGAGNDELFGGRHDDILAGGLDDDTLDGGSGADQMFGASGDDTYFVDNSSDVVSEFLGGGYDAVFSWITFTLPSGVEGLVLQDFAGSIDGTGNTLDNTISGNDRNNTLRGLDGDDILAGGAFNDTLFGGADNDTLYGNEDNDTLNGGTGADEMIGGTGNDTYSADNIGDTVEELLNQGTDTVNINNLLNFTLPANVENLVLLTGTNGTGNGLGNTITGNLLDNRLDGRGGADTLVGQLGNDTYIVDNVNDRITENGGQGIDTVRSSVSYALTVGADVETLETTDDSGVAAIDLTGNANGNVVRGNIGNNVLNGGGGRDELVGLAGQDRFLFNTALDATSNVDTITDFSVTDDTILLENTIFGVFAAGGLAAERFAIDIAQDGNDNIIYNRNTGVLFYDTDGTGSAVAIQFATVSAGLDLTNLDFFIV
jgi:Ca2+-binding RTX toxin-like protein